MARKLALIGNQYMENHNKGCGKDCRQSDLDEDEVHLHRLPVK